MPKNHNLEDVNWRKVTINNAVNEPYSIIQDTTQLAMYNDALKNLLVSSDNNKEAEIELLEALTMAWEKKTCEGTSK